MLNYINITFEDSPVNHEIESDREFKIGEYVVLNSTKGEIIGQINSGFHEKREKKEEEVFEDEKMHIVRIANSDDMKKYNENKIEAKKLLCESKKLAKKHGLEMKINSVEIALDRSKITIYFTSDGRVDFRDLVKDMASTFRSRIELKQIGARDEARNIGGFGPCGKTCCCKEFLNNFEKVSIKMAKTQNLSLNPTKISGLCGRLMCCLEYENSHYAETSSLMPKISSFVSTPNGNGIVVFNDLLKRTVSVKLGSESATEIKVFDLSEITFNKGKKWF